MNELDLMLNYEPKATDVVTYAGGQDGHYNYIIL